MAEIKRDVENGPAGNGPASIAVEGHTPDPEEDPLDDLDDLLDEFNEAAAKITKTSDQAAVPMSRNPTTVPPPEAPRAPDIDGEIAEQLQAGMAELLGELDSSPDMQQHLQQLLNEVGSAAGVAADVASPAASPPANAASAASPDANFQETIRKTMERMQESGEQATAAATSEDTDDILAELMKQMQGSGMGADGAPGSEEDFSKMLLGMMEQLTNKEILYEPMKELHEKFPAWMEKNRASTPAEDLRRYDEQKTLVSEIVGKFEESQYSDDDAPAREYIVERMQKMQAAGSPPADLVGDMSSAQEALGDLDAGCPQQ